MIRASLASKAAGLVLLLCAPAALAAQEQPTSVSAPPTPPTIFSSSRVIVEWAPGVSHAERADARDEAGVDFASDLGNRRFQLVAVEPGQTANDAVRELEADPAVAVAERDSYSAPNAIPNDPLFGELWGLRNLGLGIHGFSSAVSGADISAPTAWDRTVGIPSTVIADIDTGYRFGDAELGAVAWTNPGETPSNSADDDGNGYIDDVHGFDFVGPNAASPTSDNDPSDDNIISGGHGIHTAGTMGAAGNNGIGITGVAQDVRIMPLRVCADQLIVDASGERHEARCPTSSQVAAINYAGAKDARAANMSLGGTSFSEIQRNAIAANPQTLYVISAGNDELDNDAFPHYPCNYDPLAEGKSTVDNVICVAATNQADGLAGFSDWGANSVDLGAPGTETLSTYPAIETSFQEDFEADDFATTWSKTGVNGFGRAAAGDGPLTSFGMNDSPGEAPAKDSVYETTLTTGVAIPAGSGSCTLSGKRYRNAGSGGSFFYQVLSDDFPVFTNTGSASTGGSSLASFNTAPILGLGGHTMKLRFGYTSGSSPTDENGIWLDDLQIACYEPASAPLDYAFLQGTSMAAPHVTGAAALLFSLEPSATVTEVKDALLSSVDPDPALSGKTTTGGRLNVAKALDALEGPGAPQLTSTVPKSPSSENHPRIVGSAEAGSTVRIYEGTTCGGTPVATGTAAELSSPGIAVSVPDSSITQFVATATDAALHKSSCSQPITYVESTPFEPEIIKGPPDEAEEREEALRRLQREAANPQPPTAACTVPKLAGKSLANAKTALIAAHCALGKVTQPKAKKGRKRPALVVRSSAPAAGAKPADGKVSLVLGPKPKPKRHPHR